MTIYEGHMHHTYIVEDLVLDQDIKRRLEALGIFKGTSILILNKKKHGALVIKTRGTRFAIGKDIAKGIHVREDNL